ncbi:hypothetical protein Q7C36_003294 [Tachysurus vachellii]|uniref:Uncharacterized protein n=1 Tax=Tachysurus vachellii TaxID=175792 RepID=A0AA88NW77_TACVA|nr:hypothetical protein Q7C36_003294 [Tachysurus vachellii]
MRSELCSERPEAVTAPLPRGGQMPGSLQPRQVERELGKGARNRTEARSDVLSNSHCFQPLMFQHCYEAVQLTAPVL